ncbi:DUF1806 family protein [Cerasibacillus terrae]|uniref:DUF1806 family protein n=1 Tax=Cerasibacillus terrae TaxID=2498845 RepID=A0A5C8NVB7_9BACI|nr:YojF family protein [Cerasibacillus terrae]TXL64990.1 DUF1806 family protein [Cerasibacillus terrae]
MKQINLKQVQQLLNSFLNKTVYIHLETTNGAYASHLNKAANVGAFIRNAKVNLSHCTIVQDKDTYRVGLKMDNGWIYAEGITHWELYEETKLLMAGHDPDGRLMVALQLSETPFEN